MPPSSATTFAEGGRHLSTASSPPGHDTGVARPATDADALYEEAAATYGPALARLARAYELDPDRRRDLAQDIHLALWQSLARFDGRCSLRTWVYRVAHNVATSQVLRRKGRAPTLLSLEELAEPSRDSEAFAAVDRRQTLDRLLELIQRLRPLDRQIIMLYLEDLDAATIGEITAISAGNVATKIHRIKAILKQRFHEGGRDDA
jgi:RNA polymerase sigma-70 factor, ECF subfamily